MKSKPDQKIGRREFLKRTARAAAGAIFSSGAFHTAAQETSADVANAVPIRTLGKTGLKLPILGYGGGGLRKAWGNPLSHEDRVKLVRYAYDRGIRYFDTAGRIVSKTRTCGRGRALHNRRGFALDLAVLLMENPLR